MLLKCAGILLTSSDVSGLRAQVRLALWLRWSVQSPETAPHVSYARHVAGTPPQAANGTEVPSCPPLLQVGWPESKWRVLQASISAWQEIAQMTDAQLAWQILDDFPLSDEAVRLGALPLRPAPACLASPHLDLWVQLYFRGRTYLKGSVFLGDHVGRVTLRYVFR